VLAAGEAEFDRVSGGRDTVAGSLISAHCFPS
jgi:hypothetical protein